MKIISKAIPLLFLVVVLLISCNRFTSASEISPTEVMETALFTVKTAIAETQAAVPTVTFTASPIPQATLIPRYRQPTLIPTIEPAKIPDLLNNSLSVEVLKTFNGHNQQRITGWSNGFTGDLWDRGSRGNNQGYLWMDSNHLLLFPNIGVTQQPNWDTIYAHPVVMKIDTGKIWLPPNDRSMKDSRWFNIILPRWSPKLEVLVTAETIGGEDGVSIFTADGKHVAHYEGQLVDVSPSAERVFVVGDTWIDLGSGKKVDFGWGPGFGYELDRWFPIWSRDENQIYFCCYYYGNAKTGQSYTITNEDTIFDGGPFISRYNNLRHAYGVWLNDHVVMAKPDVWWYGGPEFSSIFDVSERTYHNLGVVADLPDAFNNNTYSYKSISPTGDYMYISPGAQSATNPQIYLVDLRTLKSQLYHVGTVDWSANGKYAIMGLQVLTLSNKTSRTLPPKPDSEKLFYGGPSAWHPTQGVRLSISADKLMHRYLYFLDVDTLTYRHWALPSNFDGTLGGGTSIIWSPNGDRLALAVADGSLWQIDYPKFENLEQLTSPIADVKDISWSPDNRYLSYVGGTDIYIVDVGGKP